MIKLLKVLVALDICVFITFLIFKVLGIIAWSFIAVFSPIWIPVMVAIPVFIFGVVIYDEISK